MAMTNSQRLKELRKKKEEENKKSSSNSPTNSQRAKKLGYERTIKFDTLESDLNSLGTTVKSIYDGWQTEETMNNTRSAVEAMYNRLNSYQEYQKLYGGADLTDVTNSYKSILDDWDNRSKRYGQYKDSKSYSIEQTKLGELNAMTMEDIEPYLKDNKKPIAYTTVGGQDITWQSLYDDKKHIKMSKSEEGKTGYAKFLEDEKKAQESKPKQSEFEETVIRGFTTSSDLPLNQIVNNVIYDKRNDDSYKKPTEDWTDEERNIFGAYYVENPQSAYDYATKLNNQKAKEEKDKSKENISKSATSNFGSGLLNWGGAILTAPFGLADYLDDLTDIAAGRDAIVEEGIITPFEYNQTVKGSQSDLLNKKSGTLNENIPVIGGKGLGDLYGLGTSIVESKLMGNLSKLAGNSVPTLISFFGQGAASSVDNALSRGASKEQALLLGSTVGALEGLSEMIGIDNMLKIGDSETFKQLLVNALVKQPIAEGLEESFSAVGEKVADRWIMGDKSNFNNLVRQYQNEGLDEKKAKWEAFKEDFEDVAFDTIGGLFSGFVHGLTEMPSSAHKINTQDKSIGQTIKTNERVNDLLNIARLTPRESDAYNLYTDYAVRNNADNMTDKQLGRLYTALDVDAKDTLSTRKSSLEQKRVATETLKKLSAISEENTVSKENINQIDHNISVREGYIESAKELIETGLESNENTKSFKLATEYKQKLDNGIELTEKEIANLVKANQMAFEGEITSAMPKEQAELFNSIYDGKSNVNNFVDSFNLVVELADKKYSQDYILEHKGILTEKQALKVYKDIRIKADQMATQKYDELIGKHNNSPFIRGNVDASIINFGDTKVEGKIDFKYLTQSQQEAISLVTPFFEGLGADVEIVDNGQERGFNALYNISNDRIVVDAYAGMDKINNPHGENNLIVSSAFHEVIHWSKDKAPELYRKLDEQIFTTFKKLGMSEMEVLERRRKILENRESEREENFKKHNPNGTYNRKTYTDEDVRDEVIARACEDGYKESEVFAELTQNMTEEERKTFIDKIREILAKMKEWIEDFFAKQHSVSIESQDLQKFRDEYLEQIQIMDDMLRRAMEVNQALKHEGVSAQEIIGKDISTHEIQLNERLVEKHIDMLNNNYSEESTLPLDTLLARYNKIVEMWKRLGGELNSQFLEDWNNKVGTDRTFSVFKAQAGYKYNVELSSMCKKGIPLFEAIDKIVKDEAMKELRTKTLGKAEKEILYDILKENNFEIPCAICYVEQARQGEGKIIDAFLNGFVEKSPTGKTLQFKLGWNEVLDNVQKEMQDAGFDYTFPSVDRSVATDNYSPADLTMDEETQEHFFEALKKVANKEIRRYNKESNKGKPKKLITKTDVKSINEVFKGKLPLNLMMFKTMFNEPSSRFKIDNDLLYSSMTTQNLAKNHNGLYSVFNAQGGVGGYKTKQGTIVYWADILKKTWKPSTLRNEGGVRNQSNSDFLMYTLLDHAQMYIDFTAKGYYLQAYTKVLAELKLFGLSKGKINASFIPKVVVYRNADGSVDIEKTQLNAGLDEQGNPIYDDVEGINHKEAFVLIEDAEYSKSIGGVCIGYSDNHILKLLDDNRIQEIIGFHDKTNDTSKRYKGAVYAKNYNGLNEATKLDKDGKLKTVHIGFNQFIRKAKNKFKSKDTIEYNGKTYKYNDIPKLATTLYLEHCENNGLFPAYSQGGIDFSKHPNYYKLLADFSLYDINGNYAPHQKVEYNMPDKVPYLDENGKKAYMKTEDYIKKELQSELVVRDSISEKLADKSENGIIPQFIERANALYDSQGTQFADRDTITSTTVSFNNNPFWIAMVNGKTGNIEKTWTYEEAESESFDLERYVDALNEDGYFFFTTDLLQDNDRIEYDDYGDALSDFHIKRINEQIEVTHTYKENAAPKPKDIAKRKATVDSLYRDFLKEIGASKETIANASFDEFVNSIDEDLSLPPIPTLYSYADEMYQDIVDKYIEDGIEENDAYNKADVETKHIYDIVDKIAKHINTNTDIRFADRDYAYWLDKIDTVSDEIAIELSKEPRYLKVLDETPEILQKYGAENLPVIIRFDAMYLAQRKDGAIPGGYHHLGKDVMSNLVKYISDPDALLETKSKEGKKRLIVLTSIPTRTGQALASIEINTLKDVDSKNDYYNVVVTFFDIGERYLRNQFVKHNAKLLHKKETLSQVNPQLLTWLRTINESVPIDSLLQDDGKSQEKLSDQDYIEIDSKAVMTTERIDYLIEDSGAGSRVDYANYWITSINPTDFLNMTLEKGWQDRSKFDKYPSEWNEESTVETYDYIGELKRNMRQTPYLAIDINTGKVDGHEGRHRMRALEKKGITSVEIRIEFRDEDGRIIKYSPDGKRLQIKDVLEIKNQYHTNQSTTLNNIIPLNKDYRDEILENYGELANANASLKYSDRDNVSVYDRMGETEKLIKENEQLKTDVERLKERLKLERQVTHGNYFNQNQLDAVAGHIRNIANSNYNKKDLVTLLNGIYQYIAHSPDLNWQDLFSQCYDVASMVLDEARPVIETNDYFKLILKDIRSANISVNEQQIQNAKQRFGNKWHNSFFGRIKISNDGMSLDSQWKVWAREYPNIFDASISDADQLVTLYNIYDNVREGSEMVVEYDMEEKTRWLAREIYNQYWNVSPIRTTADKYDKQIKRLNFEHRQAMQEFRDSYEEKLKSQHKADKEKAQELIKKIRERKDKEISEVKQRSKERMDAYKENAERKTKIQSITANALTLNKLLTKNSKEYHIHKAFRGPVVNLLNAIDFSSNRLLDKNIPTQKDISLSKALSQVKDMMMDASVGKEELVELYGHGLNDDIKSLVDSVDDMMRTVGDNEFILNRMSLEELQTLDKIVKTVKYAVNKMNKFHTVNHAKGIANLSQEEIAYADSLGKTKVYDPKTMRAIVRKLVKWDNKIPYYAFKQFGNAGRKIFEAFQDGWDKLAFHSKTIIDFAEKTYTNKEITEWEKDIKTFTVTLQDQKVQMSVPQIMSLYCLVKRKQAKGHILGGGIRVADIKMKNGQLIQQSEGVVLTENDIEKIINTLTDRQKQVADALQKFMNTTCTAWGNEVSMTRFGYEAFGEENYFPIKADDNNLANNEVPQENGSSLFKLLNMSFTKTINEKADNRIVISDIFDVFASHSSDMAKYNALALPVLDAVRWFNYTEKIPTGETQFITKSVKQSIENAFGKEGQKYIRTFLEDINGQKNVGRDTLGKGFFTKAKVASVAGNMRVALLQPTAYLKASAIMKDKYLAKAFLHKPKFKHAEKYCGIALWKSLGYYDTDISRGLTEQIKHQETWKDKAVEISLKGAEWGDKITFGYLWNACELEIRDTRKDLKVGSDEFFDAVGKRLREVIYATQVVDSTMTRSQMMRSGNMYEKIITSFASEPTLAINMLQDAYVETSQDAKRYGKKEAWKRNGKKIARVVNAYVVTNAIAAFIESGFDAFRDDDEEEMDAAKFMKYYLTNFATDMSISTKIPIVKELVSIAQGFSSSRPDTQWMQIFTNVISNVYKITQGKGNPSKLLKDGIKLGSFISGLPFYNVYRDTMAALNKLDVLTTEELEELLDELF